VSPASAGPSCRAVLGQRTGESSAQRQTVLLKKEPVIGDGSQSREDPQSRSIRGSAMCHNSHTERETVAHERDRAASNKSLGSG
jgi:hypothetical protein